jgi:hypothetical protein
MDFINSVTVQGIVQDDLILKSFDGGGKSTEFILVAKKERTFKGKVTGESILEIPISISDFVKKNLSRLPRKGDIITVTGELRSTCKEYEGNVRRWHRIAASTIELVQATVPVQQAPQPKQSYTTQSIDLPDELPF